MGFISTLLSSLAGSNSFLSGLVNKLVGSGGGGGITYTGADLPVLMFPVALELPSTKSVLVDARVDITRFVTDQQLVTMILQEAQASAGLVVDMFIKPQTPSLSGALRNTLRSSVYLDGNDVVIAFMAGSLTVDYAKYLELPWYAGRIQHYTTPGTRAPFLQPGVEEGMPFIIGRLVDMINDVG